MSNLAVKYRPKSFNDVVGQEHIIEILSNQISKNEIGNAYLFNGGSGTGKTTIARIFANELDSEIIEIDAASNNGVNDIRTLNETVQYAPIHKKRKAIIIDECVTGDTEILTDQGFKQFKNLDKTEKIAQYTKQGTIEFVTPIRHIEKHHSGKMTRFYPDGKHSVLMTPNHVQPLFNLENKQIVEKYSKDLVEDKYLKTITSGKGVGNTKTLTSFDKLVIASTADGTIHSKGKTTDYNLWHIKLGREDKIQEIQKLFKESGVIWYELKEKRKHIKLFAYRMPKNITKNLRDYFKYDFSYSRANQFLGEIFKWDGSLKSGYDGYFNSTISDNTDFVSEVAVLAGYSCLRETKFYLNPNHRDNHIVKLTKGNYRKRLNWKVSSEHYEGKTYCVEVPSNMIILRSEGYTFISGNCHMLTTGAWNALLKTLEEPKPYIVFVLCTTDPQKIPATIISRVQRYNFTLPNYNKIKGRLIQITFQEKVMVDEEVVNYIAKIANGGVRTAIVMLETCMAVGYELTVKDAEKLLGKTPTTYFITPLKHYVEGNMVELVKDFEQYHSEGVDMKNYIKEFMYFTIDLKKYILTRDIDICKIGNIYEQDLKDILNMIISIFDGKIEPLYNYVNQFGTSLNKCYDLSKDGFEPKYALQSILTEVKQ